MLLWYVCSVCIYGEAVAQTFPIRLLARLLSAFYFFWFVLLFLLCSVHKQHSANSPWLTTVSGLVASYTIILSESYNHKPAAFLLQGMDHTTALGLSALSVYEQCAGRLQRPAVLTTPKGCEMEYIPVYRLRELESLTSCWCNYNDSTFFSVLSL